MTDELLKALQLIKEECAKHDRCIKCPMGNVHGDCGLDSTSPSGWTLEKREVYF